MARKKISEFAKTTTLAGNDIFLINHLNSTSTVAFSSLSAAVTNDSVKLPSGATGGQVLTYNGSTTTWVASAVPKELPATATTGQVLTYNASTSTWVASSLSANGFTASLSSNGYTYIPNGILMQWGTFTCEGKVGITDPQVVSFPIKFPNQVFHISVSEDGGDSAGAEFSQLDFSTANKTTLSTFGVYTNYLGKAKFFAIGC